MSGITFILPILPSSRIHYARSSQRSPHCNADPPPVPRPNPPPRRDSSSQNVDVAAYNVGDTVGDSPLLNSALLNAMRDYFGDDGREIQDYMKRQVNKAGKPTYRVVLVGSGPREVETARRLSESNLISGLYYCPDMDAVCEISMKDFARSATVGAFAKEQDVVTFAKWCVADAVFVGPDRQHCISRQCEQELAAEGITVFAHDISAAIAEGKLSVAECLQGLAEEEEEKSSDVNGEKLVE